jgi:hypothetical protein
VIGTEFTDLQQVRECCDISRHHGADTLDCKSHIINTIRAESSGGEQAVEGG